METVQILLAHLPHHLLSFHLCADEMAAFANAMPHVEIFILRMVDGFRVRKCSNPHHKH